MVGKVLWWDDRHNEGQIIATDGNRYYFNYSVIKDWPKIAIKRDQLIQFKQDSTSLQSFCAIGVHVLTGDRKRKATQTFKKQLELF